MIESKYWNERHPTLEQSRKFKRLLVLHQLTGAWTQALSTLEASSFSMERMPKITLQQNLWLLEKSRVDELSVDLQSLIASEDISTYLEELAETIWLIQLSTLENALSQSSDTSLLVNIFKTTSWSQGKKAAETDWPHAKISNLIDAYSALLETHSDESSSFLIGQSTAHALSFYWSKSPYLRSTLNHSVQVETLVQMHEEWIHGFFYGLSRNFQCTSHPTLVDGKTWVEFKVVLN